jgi:hypothetical protein
LGGHRQWHKYLRHKNRDLHTLQKKDLTAIQTNDGFIIPIAIDTLQQKAWLSTDAGVFKMDMRTWKCTPAIFKKLNNVIISDPGVPKLDGNRFSLLLIVMRPKLSRFLFKS